MFKIFGVNFSQNKKFQDGPLVLKKQPIVVLSQRRNWGFESANPFSRALKQLYAFLLHTMHTVHIRKWTIDFMRDT